MCSIIVGDGVIMSLLMGVLILMSLRIQSQTDWSTLIKEMFESFGWQVLSVSGLVWLFAYSWLQICF